MNKQRKSREAFEEKHTHGKQSTEHFDCNNYTTDKGTLSNKKIHTEIYGLIGTGEQNAIHQKELVKLTGLSVREITISIEYLRRSGKVILSSCNGYFKPETMAEVNAHINRERSRAKNILKTLETVEEYKKKVERL